MLALVATMALGSAAAYTRFGDFSGPRAGKLHTIHDHDIYHYAMGAKYYPELGHELLYECTWLAFAENRSAGIRGPKVPLLRSLSDPTRFFNPNHERPRIEKACHDAFSPRRWRMFKSDLRVWLERPWGDQPWRVAMVDLGFNPPPTYNLIAHNIANLRPLDITFLHAMPFVDMTMVFLVGGAMVWWAFGPWALCAYLIVFGTNWAASYRWTGGSFCRQLWFCWLVYGICFLKKKRYEWAGAMLAMCASMRVFPLVFVVGAITGMAGAAWRDPKERVPLQRLVLGGLGTAITLTAMSVFQFGTELWAEFFHKMSHHGTSYFMWHIGFKKWALFYPEVVEASGVRLAKGWWWAPPATFDALWERHRVLHEGLRISLSLAAVALAWRRNAMEATLVLGGVLLFMWSMPANYYYVYFAMMPVVFYSDKGGLFPALRTALVFLTMLSLSCAPFIHREPFVMNGWWNRTMFWFFAALLATYAIEAYRDATAVNKPDAAAT